MPLYLLQVAYTSEGWASLLKSPQNRLDAVRPAVEKLGGKIETGWFCFGDYDLVSILQMPDNVSAAAFSVAASAGGAIKAIKTTPLLSLEDGVEGDEESSDRWLQAAKEIKPRSDWAGLSKGISGISGS
jgi:uncharacterized protein with GYD domain